MSAYLRRHQPGTGTPPPEQLWEPAGPQSIAVWWRLMNAEINLPYAMARNAIVTNDRNGVVLYTQDECSIKMGGFELVVEYVRQENLLLNRY